MSLVIFLAATAGAAPLSFTDITASAVHTTTMQSGQLDKEHTVGDFDNDGDLDVILGIADGIFGSKRNMVYRNDGGVLNEVSTALVPEFFIDTLSRRPFLRDIDGDGWLDLIVVNDELASGYAGHTHLWMNSHPGGVFAGFVQEDARLAGAGGDSCGAAMVDFDNDGDMDLYSGNYPGGSQDTMYLNDGNGWFTEVTSTMVPIDSDYTTDVVTADFNGDGTLDISLGNHFNPSRVYYNNLLGQSSVGDLSTNNSVDITVNSTTHHNATEPFDADNDGDIDLYMANYTGDEDALYINTGLSGGKAVWSIQILDGFQSQLQESSKPEAFDLNDDGRMDMLVPAQDGRPVMLRNTSIGGTPSFVDWTPPAIQNGTTHSAFSATWMDVDNDSYNDIVIFGHTADHVLRGGPASAYDASVLGAFLPSTAAGPVVIEGRGKRGDKKLLYTPSTVSSTYMAAITQSCGDVRLDIGSEAAGFAMSNRAGRGGEEVASMSGTQGGRIGVQVTLISACGDADNDGDMDFADYQAAVSCYNNPTASCIRTFDANLDGALTAADRDILFADSAGPNRPTTTRYTLELLTR